MRSLLLASFLLITVALQAQGELIAAANAALARIAEANADEARDSASQVLSGTLRTLLEREDAMGLDLAGLRMSRVDAPDGRFRLLTWNVPHQDGSHRYHGLLLVQERKRRVVHELQDRTRSIEQPERRNLTTDQWYGALYYQVIPTRKGGRTWYTLLGWKGHSAVETRKVIEVLSFRGSTPQFGAPLFGEGRVRDLRRVYGFSFQNSMSLKWDEAGQRIVLDHLSPTKPEFAGQPAFMGPDLSYDAFVWEKDHWRFERDVDVRQLDLDKPWNRPPKEQR
ncbi:MAG: hypothetical protein U0U25_07695 [Flavobacteriales bacterium]